MDWRASLFLCTTVWSTYAIFGERATTVHGDKVSLVFETVGFILITVALLWGALGDFHKVTTASFINGAIMGLFSAGGFYLMLLTFRLAPDKFPIVMLCLAICPVLTVLIKRLMGTQLLTHQWIGATVVFLGLIIFNWPKKS